MSVDVLVPKGGSTFNLPLSPGLKSDDFIFVSGQVPFDQEGNLVGKGDVKKQTEQVLKNVEAVLASGGATLGNVLKVVIYLRDVSHFQDVNEVYKKFFKGIYPARTTIGADLALDDMLIEIDVIARA